MAASAPSGNAQYLNSQFHMLLAKLQENLASLKIEEKQLALQWAERLKKCSLKMSDLHLRRKVMVYLVMQAQAGSLTAPFDKPPVFTNLEQVSPQVPDLSHDQVFPEDFKLPIIMENSPDHGAFLVSQPIPKCGAFCYLAVVSRPANK